jgi:hypothetical protein
MIKCFAAPSSPTVRAFMDSFTARLDFDAIFTVAPCASNASFTAPQLAKHCVVFYPTPHTAILRPGGG